MNIVKISIAAASLLLVSAQAMALVFTPPYHNQGGWTGKGAVQSSGSCSVKETFVDAQYGSIYDDTNAYVGWGMVSNGQILVLEQDSDQTYTYDDTATGDSGISYFEDMATQTTMDAIESFAKPAGCSILQMVSGAKSRETGTVKVSKGLDQYTLQYTFGGVTDYELPVVKGTKTYKKTKSFSGKITFKGTRPLVI